MRVVTSLGRAGMLGACAALVVSGCASSSSRERYEQDYALRWAVDVDEKPDDVKTCRRVSSFEVASLPCTNILPGVYMAGTECARFWAVDRGGDTLLVKRGNVGDVYVCRAPLLSTAALESSE